MSTRAELQGMAYQRTPFAAEVDQRSNFKQEHELSNENNPLTRSLIEQFYPQNRPNNINSAQARQMGSTVLDRAEQIFHQTKALRNLASNAYENPTRFGCSVFAFIAGLTQIYSGDVVSGSIATLIGAKEVYNQSGSGNTLALQRLLNDINADVDMIRTLEEGQQQSYKAVQENLNLIKSDVDVLYKNLDEIGNLNDQGIKSIEESKRRAYEKGVAAKEAYRRALSLFSEAKDAFSSSKEIYEKCARSFILIQGIAKDEGSEKSILEKVNELVEVANQASGNCAKGKKELDIADEKFSLAMQALSEASNLKDEASGMISKTVQNAEDTLRAGIEKAQYTQECSQRIKATQNELEDIKERSNDVMYLLNEMSTEVKKAKIEAQKKLDPSDLVVGIGTGVALSSLGTFSALAAGVTAAYAWHNGTTIADTTKKVYNYFFGIPLPAPEAMREDQLIRVNMDEKSSGYYGGWVKGRPSYTYGSLDVKLGKEIVQFRFDLNQRDYPVSKEDLFTLFSKMFAKLEDKSISSSDSEKILHQLETVSLSRGGLYDPVRGLVKNSQAAFGLVKALRKYCEKLKASVL